MIVITGATGKVGGLVAQEVSRRGLSFRAVVRDESRAPDLAGAEVVVADFGDPDAVARALSPGDRVFMVSMYEDHQRRLELHRSFIETAARRRVARIVYLSFIAAGPDAHFHHARSHGETEVMLAESGVRFTAVRNGIYADDLVGWFDAEGRITAPGGEGRLNFSPRLELGEAIATLLTDETHDGRQLVTIVGPEAVSLAELAEIASTVTGDRYRYEPGSREEWADVLRRQGRAEWSIAANLSYFDGVVAGEAEVVSDDYRELTGREPRTIAQLLASHRDGMPLSP